MGEVKDLIDYATEVAELIERGGTSEELIESSIMFLRKKVYQRFPNFEPKVLEALMLLYKEMIYQMYGDIQKGIDMNTPIKDLSPELNEEYNKVARMLGKAFMQTVKKLSGEG